MSCHRAKARALFITTERHDEQYKRTREKDSNNIEVASTYIKGEGSFFQRMYVCLDACK